VGLLTTVILLFIACLLVFLMLLRWERRHKQFMRRKRKGVNQTNGSGGDAVMSLGNEKPGDGVGPTQTSDFTTLNE
jgi:hypothetical protein